MVQKRIGMMEKIKDQVKRMIDRLQKKDVQRKSVLYMNKPISKEHADEIGMNIYVDYLESAIQDGADMISVISRFGTGKSSLIELLKEKYNGVRKREKRVYRRIYCEINLWSQLESNGNNGVDEEEVTNQTLELHRIFLYQLIASVLPSKSGYFSRRTSRNFGMLKISGESRFWNISATIVALLLGMLIFIQGFSEEIVAAGLLEQKFLDKMFIGYILCGVIALFIFLKTEIVFSSKNSEGNRKIEENELIELYRKHVLVQKNLFYCIKSWLFRPKHIVVVIEDLDRAENGDRVYHFMKELRKYYVPNEQSEKNFINKITFIVNIMPEDLLRDKCSEKVLKTNYVYDKLFDYSIKLNRINIDNFDAILEALIIEKREELSAIGIEVKDTDNVHGIKGMHWIIHGKELTLRQMKERLNDAIVLYESLRYKFDNKHADFEKCAVVAYLRNTYSKQFYNLSDRQLDEMLTWYAKNPKKEALFVKKFGTKKHVETDFIRELYVLIEAHLIDGNYRSYFFNYPKKSHLYNVQEMKVRNLIIYNEQLTPEGREDIKQVLESKPEVIIDALENEIGLIGSLPEVVFFSKELWDISCQKYKSEVVDLLKDRFATIDKLEAEDYTVINSIATMQDGIHMLCNSIELDKKPIGIELRKYLLEKYPEYIDDFAMLYENEKNPLEKEEVEKMSDVALERLLNPVIGTISSLNGAVIKEICNRILMEKDETALKDAENFYVQLVKEKGIENTVSYVVEYMTMRECILPELLDKIFSAAEEGRIDKGYYYRIINNVPAELIEEEHLRKLAKLGDPQYLDEGICESFKQRGWDKEYILNMLILDSERIDLSFERAWDVMKQNGLELFKENIELFLKLRKWICEKYMDEAVFIADYFKQPYPLITNEEAECLRNYKSIFELYDVEQASNDNKQVYANYCNSQLRKGEIAYELLSFITSMKTQDIPDVFYSLNMKMVQFSSLDAAQKKELVDKLHVALGLDAPDEIVEFMQFTKCLIPELEIKILPSIKDKANKDLCKEYIKTVQMCGMITEETIKNVCAMPRIYAFGDVINEALYEKGRYRMYICSKTMEANAFVVEEDKLDVLWDEYLSIFRNIEKNGYTWPRMSKNLEFLKMIQEREAYEGLPETSRLSLASIPQDKKTLRDVLKYPEGFVVEYFSNIVEFVGEAATEFLNIMIEYPEYAKNEEIYQKVHPLMSGNIKRQYTILHNEAKGK